ncbi:hypothetical protein BVG19_g1867 [[Candida] boidinii]|nr:hypothetical protein BVG19_g1867 [[Candida] boidinii]OWB51449.1 hypothetical protein B5S27_g3010 [[Candida] boidinii]
MALTEEQESKLQQFKEITQYDEETEKDKVIRLLEVTGWNLETSISRYFEKDFPSLANEDFIPDQFHSFTSSFNNSNFNPIDIGGLNPTQSSSASSVSASNNRNINNNNHDSNFASMDTGSFPRTHNVTQFQFDTRFVDLVPKLPKAVPISNSWRFTLAINNRIDNSVLFNGGFNNPYSTNPILNKLMFLVLLVPKLFWFIGLGLNKIIGDFYPGLFRILGLREAPNDFPSTPIYLRFPPKPPLVVEEDEEDDNGKKEEVKELSEKKSSSLASSTGDVSAESGENYSYFRDYINELVGETTDLSIFEGNFNEAFNKSKSELRWLMVILVNSNSELSKTFVKSYLNNHNFIKFINDNNIILYCGDVVYAEPFEVGKTYRAYSLPYVCLVSNVSATGASHPLMSIVTKYQNFQSLLNKASQNATSTSSATTTRTDPYNVQKLIKSLQRVLDKYEPQLITQRYDKQEADFARLLRQQQDEAYELSLLKDKQRAEERKQKDLIESLERQRIEDEIKLKLLREEQRKLFIISNIKSILIDKEEALKTAAKGDYTTIQLRTHHGLRIIRKFLKNDSLYDLFLFAECKLFIHEIMNESDSPNKKESEIITELLQSLESSNLEILNDYIHEFKFELVSPMPRCKFQPSKDIKLSAEKVLWPNGSILIEKYSPDDEDSSDEEEEDDEEEDDEEDY